MVLKKVFIISIILLFVVLVFFGIYSIAFKEEQVKVEEIIQKGKQVEVTEVLAEKITNITSEPIVSASVDLQGESIRYYDAVNGRAWTMTLRGANVKSLTKDTLGVPKSAKWSYDAESTILKYDDGNIIVHNHVSGVDNKLREGMDDVVWAGKTGKILYKYYNEETKERSLNIANSDGTNWKKIANLPFKDTVFTQIPTSIFAAFWPVADNNVDTELFVTTTLNESEPKKIFSGKKGADYLFSPNGEKVLVSSSIDGGKKITLGIMDSDGKNYIDLKIPTLVQKAVWSADNRTVFYAQPNNVSDDVVWPNDYNNKIIKTTDTFYKLDIATNKKTRIVELEEIKEQFDAVDLFLSPSEDVLFFTNRTNGLLYRIKL
jgi:hypothetical protein